MSHRKQMLLSVAVILLAGLSTSAAAQRETTTRTAVYTIESSEVEKGASGDAANTYYVTYTGKVQGRTSTRNAQARAFSLSLEYKVGGTTARIVSGRWRLTTVREGLEVVSGGPVLSGGILKLKSDNTPAGGNYTLGLKSDDEELPSDGTISLTVDQKKTKVNGSLVLNYTVVL